MLKIWGGKEYEYLEFGWGVSIVNMCISKSNKGIEERLVNCSSFGAPDVALLSALEPQQRCTLPFGCTVPFFSFWRATVWQEEHSGWRKLRRGSQNWQKCADGWYFCTLGLRLMAATIRWQQILDNPVRNMRNSVTRIMTSYNTDYNLSQRGKLSVILMSSRGMNGQTKHSRAFYFYLFFDLLHIYPLRDHSIY